MPYANLYLEQEVLGATRIELIKLLYKSALDTIAHARRCLKSGAILERSRHITKAWEILAELSHALDHAEGGEISRSLHDLYAYMQSRLLEANAKQSEEPLAEVEKLLATLADAWSHVPEIEGTY